MARASTSRASSHRRTSSLLSIACISAIVTLLLGLLTVSAANVPANFVDTPENRASALADFFALVEQAQQAANGAGSAAHSLAKRGFDFNDFVSLFNKGLSPGCFFGLLDPKVGVPSSNGTSVVFF